MQKDFRKIMDVSDWAKPEVIQLLEQYIQESIGSIEELHQEIQRVTGKNITVQKLQHHLQLFQKVTLSDPIRTYI